MLNIVNISIFHGFCLLSREKLLIGCNGTSTSLIIIEDILIRLFSLRSSVYSFSGYISPNKASYFRPPWRILYNEIDGTQPCRDYLELFFEKM